jgi:hypothetical protein
MPLGVVGRRGWLPKWLQILEAEGHKREEYLIEKPAAAAE